MATGPRLVAWARMAAYRWVSMAGERPEAPPPWSRCLEKPQAESTAITTSVSSTVSGNTARTRPLEPLHRGRQVVAGVSPDHQAVILQAHRALASAQHGREGADLGVELSAELGEAVPARRGPGHGGAVVGPHLLPCLWLQQVGLRVGVAPGALHPHVARTQAVPQPPQERQLPEPTGDLVLAGHDEGQPRLGTKAIGASAGTLRRPLRFSSRSTSRPASRPSWSRSAQN